MATSMDELPAAEGGLEVTREMIRRWCEAYENGKLPDGYAFDGPIKPGRPKLADEAIARGAGIAGEDALNPQAKASERMQG